MLRTTARQTTMRKLEFGWFLPTRGDTDDYGEPLKVPASFDMFRDYEHRGEVFREEVLKLTA